MDVLQNKMESSWFRLSDEAVAVVRKMLDPENAESYDSLNRQFMEAIPEGNRDCFLNVDFYAGSYPWSHSALSQDDYLVVFDPGEDVVAVISHKDVLHKEDFAEIMKENDLTPTEGNFNVVWLAFCDIARKASSGFILQERALAAVRAAKEQISALSVDEILGIASQRSCDASRSDASVMLRDYGDKALGG